jgi:hypothetical protein
VLDVVEVTRAGVAHVRPCDDLARDYVARVCAYRIRTS